LQNTPLHPVTEWGRLRFGGTDVPAERQLADLENTLTLTKLDPAENVPLLAPLLDVPLPKERMLTLAPEELRRRQFAALRRDDRERKGSAVVLAFEDLHWADPTTLDVLRGLGERGALAPLFIVATARPEFRPPWSVRSHHGTISLAPLDRSQVRDMVAELSAHHALPQEVVEDVAALTCGVPLFVEEVTRLLLERGGEQGGIHAIPPTLQQSLTARLDRLGSAREVAQIGAVIGRDFSYKLLREIAGLAEAPLQAALEKLADADILLVQGLPPASDYRFKHALIQDAAYENLLKSRRQALHRRTAEVLRDQFADTAAAEPALLAHHFTQAGLTEAAIEWWRTAGQRSLARSALVEGFAQLKGALDQIATLSATPKLRHEEIKLEVAFANALTLTGDLMQGKEHYDRALAIYDPAEHGPLTTRSGRDVGVALLASRSSCLWQLGYPEASCNDGERAVKNARERGQATTSIFALHAAGYNHFLCGNYTAAKAQLDELIALADERAAPYWKATGTGLRGSVFGLTGKASEAVRAITSTITSLRSSETTIDVPFYLSQLAMAYAELGQPDDARRCIDDAIETMERSMEKWGEAEVHRVAGEIALKSLTPDLEKAEAYFDRALAVARRQQSKSWELRAAMSMARLWRDQGKRDEARELLAPVYGWFTEGFDTFDLKEAKALLGELAS
jgi:predicted ATPase